MTDVAMLIVLALVGALFASMFFQLKAKDAKISKMTEAENTQSVSIAQLEADKMALGRAIIQSQSAGKIAAELSVRDQQMLAEIRQLQEDIRERAASAPEDDPHIRSLAVDSLRERAEASQPPH